MCHCIHVTNLLAVWLYNIPSPLFTKKPPKRFGSINLRPTLYFECCNVQNCEATYFKQFL